MDVQQKPWWYWVAAVVIPIAAVAGLATDSLVVTLALAAVVAVALIALLVVRLREKNS